MELVGKTYSYQNQLYRVVKSSRPEISTYRIVDRNGKHISALWPTKKSGVYHFDTDGQYFQLNTVTGRVKLRASRKSSNRGTATT